MPAGNAGTAYVDVVPVVDKFASELERKIGPSLQSVGKKISSAGSKLTRSVTLPIVAGFGLAIKSYTEAAEVGARTNAIIKATGGAAGLTAKDVEALAGSIRDYSGVDDEVIQQGANLLLTFKKVRDETGKGNDVFTRATKAMVDLSQAGFGSVDSASKMLGKALQDPLKGVTALSRAGVTFTDQQRKQIETLVESGKSLEAQKLILAEVESQVGGTAKAIGKTAGGRMKIALSKLGDAGEQIGGILIPVFSKLGEIVGKVAAWFADLSPSAKKMIVTILAVAAAVGPVLIVLGKLVSGLGAVVKAFGVVTKVLAANPYVLLIAATIAIVVLIVKNWDRIKAFLVAVWNAIKAAAVAVWNAIKGFFVGLFNALKAIVTTWINAWKTIILTVWNAIKTAAITIWNAIKTAIVTPIKAVARIIGTVMDTIASAWETVWNGIKTVVSNIWDGIKQIAKDGLNFLIGIVNGVIGALNRVVDAIDTALGPFINFGSIPNIPTLAEGGAFTTGPGLFVAGEGRNPFELVTGKGVVPLTSSRAERIMAGVSGGLGVGGGRYRVVEGRLTIDEQGRAWIRALAAEEAADEVAFRAGVGG